MSAAPCAYASGRPESMFDKDSTASFETFGRKSTSVRMPNPGQGFSLGWAEAIGIDARTWVTKLGSVNGVRSSGFSRR